MMRAKSSRLCATTILLSAVGGFAAAADSPLAAATAKRDRGASRARGQRHAGVNAPQADGMTALHWAAYQDDSETVQLLVRSGATVKAANRYGVTPLTLAITNGNADTVELLLKSGADPNTMLPGGETAL